MLSLYVIYFYFHDIPSSPANSPLENSHPNSEYRNKKKEESKPESYRSDRTYFLIALGLLNLFLKGTMSCFETLGINFAEARFHLSNEQTANIISACGFFGSLILLTIKIWIAEKLDDIQIMSLGYVFYVAGICMHVVFNDETDSYPTLRYMLSMFCIYSVGYPVSLVGLLGLFSKGSSMMILLLYII